MLSKNRKNTKLLGRKTKREISSNEDIIEIEEDKTTINLIYLNNNKYNTKNYTYIKFSFSNKISLENLIKNKEQSIMLDINCNEIYIVDKIELGNDKINIKQNFLLPIYINKVNTCYISLKPKDNEYFFELIFYSKTMKNLPRYLEYENEQKIQVFDNYDLKYRKKINIINVGRNFVNSYIKNITLDSNSYKICARIKNTGEIFSSLHELKLEKKLELKKNLIKPNLDDIDKIQNLFIEFKKSKNLENIKKKYKVLNNDNAFKKFIKRYTYAKAPYSEIPDINDDAVNILKEYILKFILKYFFININEIKTQIIDKQLQMIDNIMEIINDIEQFSENKKDSTILKYRLYRATLYNLYSVTQEDAKNKFYCLSILAKYKQKIIDINQSSKDNPYYKAITFLKEVASKLNEKSCLFDLLMQYNSGISEDIILLGENNKNNKVVAEDTKYELSLLTVEEITKHLTDILPDFIIRYTCNNDIYSFYSSLNDLIFINEQKTFNDSIICSFDNKMCYTLPIVLLLIHECWGHMKVVKSNKIKRESPIKNYLRSGNFNEELMEIIEKKTGKIKGESGLELENLIIGSKDKFFSEFLLNKYENINKNLLNSDLWVKTSFKDFQNLMRKNVKKTKNKSCEINLSKNRENEADKDLSKYCLKTYYEDDVEIDPLYIV